VSRPLRAGVYTSQQKPFLHAASWACASEHNDATARRSVIAAKVCLVDSSTLQLPSISQNAVGNSNITHVSLDAGIKIWENVSGCENRRSAREVPEGGVLATESLSSTR